jgi:PilZ domain
MIGVRRSGRVRKNVPIILIGTDATGRVFSEQTNTVVLSRHGAGIVSRNTFAPEEVLTLRFSESSREADVRLVGRIGDTPKGFIYGVEFLDAAINYWGLEFPPPENYSEVPRGISLECAICHDRTVVEQSEIEADVFLATGSVFRSCENCGQTTAWRKPAHAVARAASLPSASPAHPPAGALPSGQLPNAAAGASFQATALLEEIQSDARPTLAAQGPARRENRRKHVRTRVSFMALIRFPLMGDEIVECENVSKGGLCFRSKKRYPDGALLEIAAPYEPGMPGMFVHAQIKRVEQLPDRGAIRYGAAYVSTQIS